MGSVKCTPVWGASAVQRELQKKGDLEQKRRQLRKDPRQALSLLPGKLGTLTWGDDQGG